MAPRAGLMRLIVAPVWRDVAAGVVGVVGAAGAAGAALADFGTTGVLATAAGGACVDEQAPSVITAATTLEATPNWKKENG